MVGIKNTWKGRLQSLNKQFMRKVNSARVSFSSPCILYEQIEQKRSCLKRFLLFNLWSKLELVLPFVARDPN